MNASSHNFPPMIVGDFIYLRKLSVDDAELTYQWRISSAAQFMNQPDGYCLAMQRRWIETRPDAEINYIIMRSDNSERIGMVSIVEVNWSDRVSGVGRLLLDEKYIVQSQPYGVEALQLTYGYVFNIMNFRKIYGVINTKNEKVYELQKFLGMSQEGLLKRHSLLHGKEEDLYAMSLFKEEFAGYSAKIDAIINKFKK